MVEQVPCYLPAKHDGRRGGVLPNGQEQLPLPENERNYQPIGLNLFVLCVVDRQVSVSHW